MRNGETQSDVSTLVRALRTGLGLVYEVGCRGSMVSRHQHSADVGHVFLSPAHGIFHPRTMRLRLRGDRFLRSRRRSKNFRPSHHARLADAQLVGRFQWRSATAANHCRAVAAGERIGYRLSALRAVKRVLMVSLRLECGRHV